MTDPVLEGSKTLSLTLSFGPDPCPDPWRYILTSLWGRLGRRRKSKWRLGGFHFISMPSPGWIGHKKDQRRSNRILYNQITWRCYGFKCHKGDFNDYRDSLLFTIIHIEWDEMTGLTITNIQNSESLEMIETPEHTGTGDLWLDIVVIVTLQLRTQQ